MALFFILAFLIIVVCSLYNYNLAPVDKNDDEEIIVEIPNGTSVKGIGNILEEKDLVKNANFFYLYCKIYEANSLKATTYSLKKSMTLKEIVAVLEKGNSYNPDQITLTFPEGINMRRIANIISSNTNNKEEDVYTLMQDTKYLDELIGKYWFISDEIKNTDLYYPLEGYLYPNTYTFKNKDVTVKEIFKVMLDQMEKVLEEHKGTITNSKYSAHQLLTMASIVEKEGAAGRDKYPDNPKKVASVFYNRLKSNWSLGSDVTTRYALKIDDAKQALNTTQYQYKSPYNTRLTDGSMNGKLPVGPICNVGKESLEAALYPAETEYYYFLANIETKETFFFTNSRDFEIKKSELQYVNQGL